MRKYIAAIAVLSALGCEPLEQRGPDVQESPEDKVCLSVRASHKTKSSMQLSENSVPDLNVYAYRGGLLEVESYSADDQVELELVRNAVYRIYALSGCGQLRGPVHESELSSVSIAPSEMAMCFREGVQIVAGASTSSLEIPLTRLFARYTLQLDNNLEYCDYQITSVKVKQQAAAVRPFAPASAALATTDGDTATAADLAALNNGQGAVFYVPENCQGILLPSNEDPWAKIPSNLPVSKRALCTYLSIGGTWTTSGATADLGLKLMLGADNCTDFNVVRNTATTITLSLGDEGTLKSSWKVDLDNLDDERILSFPDSVNTVFQENGWTRIPLTVSPSDMAYSAAFSDTGSQVMDVKVENGEVWVRGLYDGDQRPQETLTVTSWDGRHSSSTDITLDFHYGELTAFDYYLPTYAGEYGWFEFPEASESRPVRVRAADWSTSIGPQRGENCEYYLDSQNGMEYYVRHDLHKMFIRPVRSGGVVQFDFIQYKSRAEVTCSQAVLPQLTVEDCIVSESGCRSYENEHKFYYDSYSNFYLADSQGNRLDISRFRIPDELLAYKGLSGTAEGYYHDFLNYYGALPTVQSSANYGSRVLSWSNMGDVADLVDDQNLARVYYYGIADYGASSPSFPMTATLRVGSGETITASSTLTGVQAFPSQRYLGVYYNYQLAPGAMRSLTTSVDFTSGGRYYAPGAYGVSWAVCHADGSKYTTPETSVAGGSSDNYSAGASMQGNVMSFRQMDQTTFPACGMLGLTGTVTNPYSGKTYTGYYTLSMVLYVAVGCHIEFLTSNKASLSFVPFSEFTVSGNQSIWASCFPSGIKVQSEYGSSEYPLWNSPYGVSPIMINSILSSSTLEEVTEELSRDMSKLRFSFKVAGQSFQQVTLDRSFALFISDGSWVPDGSHGYYKLVRQYDLGTFNHGDKYNGLENYLIEAAYESLNMY